MISLFPHQQEALQETKDFDNIAVYHDMGLGKTFTGSEMMKRFGCKVNLIVCQKSKVQDWVEHFTDNYQMQVFDLTNKKQLGEYHGLSQGQRFFIVGVINYELAWRRKELLDIVARVVVEDDETRTLNFKSNEVIFGGGRLKNIKTTSIPLDWNELLKVYDEANFFAKPAEEIQEDAKEIAEETPSRRGRKSRTQSEPVEESSDEPVQDGTTNTDSETVQVYHRT